MMRFLLLTSLALICSAPATGQSNADSDIRRDATVAAIEAVMPSVVNISTETIVEIRDHFDSLFRQFFGPNWGRTQQSLGSGVIIDEEGYILTNLHVINRATRITVTLHDGRVFTAKRLIGTTKTDVALLKIEEKERFTAVKFAQDDDLLLGETVLALGNPFGLGGSVTRGILSSKARRPPIEDESLDINDWLQTDAAINPGNSGGPLINLRGELIGINVAIFREAQGIGFAIPIKRIAESLGTIFTPEEIKGLWFGGVIQRDAGGLVVREVQPDSPAEKAGLRPNDTIVSLDNKKPGSLIEFNRELIKAGDRSVRLIVQRENTRKTLTVRMMPEAEFFNNELIRQKLGLDLQTLTPDLVAAMGLSRAQGLVITEIEKNSPAYKAQLQPGDIVEAIDSRVPDDVVDAAKLVHNKKGGDAVRLNVIIRRARGNFVRLFSKQIDLILR